MASWILPKNERWGIFLNIKMPQCSFFGRIKDNIFFFRNLLTFSWKSCKSSQKAAVKSNKYETFLMVQTVLIIWINHIHDSYSKIISWIFSGNKSNQDLQLSMKKFSKSSLELPPSPYRDDIFYWRPLASKVMAVTLHP